MAKSTQLRPEAKPLEWEMLNDAQREAFRQLAQQIKDAVDDLENRDEQQIDLQKSDRVLTWIRHDALARLSMLEGGRGSGKTTVLLSLLDLCDSKKANGLPTDLHSLLKEIDKRTVWLDPIDLDMFPPSANLLAAILARLEARVGRKVADEDAQRDPEALRHWNQPDALRQLNDLYRKVAVAWGGYEKLREPENLDAYTTNVKRIELERLELRGKFSRLLDKLAERVFRDGRHDNPIFVLPIDDFDLNPSRCFSVLNVLRQVSVPRLYAVVLGSFALAREMVHLRFVRDFRDASDKGLDNAAFIDSRKIRRLLEETSEAWLRKSIPPLQRVRIAELKPPEILLFRPPGPDLANRPRLFQLLAELPIVIRPPQDVTTLDGKESLQPEGAPFGMSVPKFLDFCVFPGIGMQDSTEQWPRSQQFKDLALGTNEPGSFDDKIRKLHPATFEQMSQRSAYQAPALMRAVPRNVADIWLRTYHAVQSTRSTEEGDVRLPWWRRWRELLRIAKDLCWDEVAQDAAFTAEEQAALQFLLDRCLDREADLETARLTFTSEVEPPRIVRTSDNLLAAPPDRNEAEPDDERGSAKTATKPREETLLCQRTIVVHKARGWRLTPRDRTATDARECSPQTAAQFMIFHDLVTLSNRRLRGIFPNMPFDQPWAATQWDSGPYGNVYLLWPQPLLHSFWEYDIFLKAWNQVIRDAVSEVTDGDVAAESLMYCWIDLSLAFMTWKQPLVTASGSLFLPLPPQDKDWRQLMARLDEAAAVAASESTLYGLRLSHWLTRIAMLLMPELLGPGLQTERRKKGGQTDRPTLDELTLGAQLHEFWTNNLESIRQQRVKNLAGLVGEGMIDVVDRILKASRKRTHVHSSKLGNVIYRTAPTINQVKAFAKTQPAQAHEMERPK